MNKIYKKSIEKILKECDNHRSSPQSYSLGHVEKVMEKIFVIHSMVLLEEMTKWLKKRKIKRVINDEIERQMAKGYNLAITETISHLEQELQLIQSNV